jgi:potassium efflux system protein
MMLFAAVRRVRSTPGRALALLLGLSIFLSCSASPAPENPAAPPSPDRRRTLQDEQEGLTRAQDEIQKKREETQKQIANLDPSKITAAMLEQARLGVESARVQLEGAKLDLQAEQRTIQDLEASIRDLENQIKTLKGTPPPPDQTAAHDKQLGQLQESLNQKKSALDAEQQHLVNLQATQQLARDRLSLADEWYRALQAQYLAGQEQSRREALEDLRARLQKEQQAWAAKAADLRAQADAVKGDDPTAASRRHLLQARADDAEARGRLVQLQVKMAQARATLSSLESLHLSHDTPIETLKTALDQAQGLVADLSSTQSLLQQKSVVLGQQQQVAARRETPTDEARKNAAEEERILASLARDLEEAATGLTPLIDAARAQQKEIQASYEESFRRGLFARRTLLPHDIEGWKSFLQQLSQLPALMAQQLWDASVATAQAAAQAKVSGWVGLGLLSFFWSSALLWGRELLRRLIRATEAKERSFSGDMALALLDIAERSVPPLTVAGIFVLALWLLDIPNPALTLVPSVLAIWLVIKLLLDIAYLLLKSPRLPHERRQYRLYGQIYWVLMVGGALSTVTLLGHLLTLPTLLRDFIDRTFMLFFFLVVWPTLGIRRLVLLLLAERFDGAYWLKLVRLFSLLAPLSVLATATLGLAGYINLAWTVGQDLLWFLAVLAAWLILRGLLRDFSVSVKNYANLHSNYGLLWAQGVIEPLHRVSRVALFLLAWAVLFQLYGWGAESAAVRWITRFVQAPLFTFGQATIDLQSILLTVLALLVVFWLGRWTREATYRWIYSRILDLGARHSLSVFTQYAVILLGLVITLRSIGIDLTTLAVFAGALGVGIGLGLQSTANNFISGLLLLLERPLRSGDIVEIGTSQGEVTRIGIRSLTVKTWDNQEVIIPNAEVISNAFTNWTRTDNVVRTKLSIGVSYDADPREAKRAIEQVFKRNPAVLNLPEPRVWLSEFGDSSVNLHVQYFIDVRRYNRLEVKSQVLFAIWDALKEADIGIPYPQRDVYIKAMPKAAATQQGAPDGTTTPEAPG